MASDSVAPVWLAIAHFRAKYLHTHGDSSRRPKRTFNGCYCGCSGATKPRCDHGHRRAFFHPRRSNRFDDSRLVCRYEYGRSQTSDRSEDAQCHTESRHGAFGGSSGHRLRWSASSHQGHELDREGGRKSAQSGCLLQPLTSPCRGGARS